jgi:hypothetical protein
MKSVRTWLLMIATLGALGISGVAGASKPEDPPQHAPSLAAAQALAKTAEVRGGKEVNLGGGAAGPMTAERRQVSPFQVPGLSKLKAQQYRLMGYMCWFVDGMYTRWGTYPYEKVVAEHRYWCGYFEGGAQTYRSSSVHLGGTFCGGYDAAEQRIAGGNGYNHTIVRTAGSFNCPTPWWWSLNSRHWQDWSCDTYTWTACVRTGDGSYW